MKILFAAPDRDLLECYKKLLEPDFGEIVTAFDGTQVFSLFAAEKFDLVILDCDIPRIEHKRILMRINEKQVPVILLTNRPLQITAVPDPNAYLSYPFTADQITAVIRNVLENSKRTKKGSESVNEDE